MLPGPRHRGSLPYERYLLAPFTGNKNGASAFWYSELSLHQLGSPPTVLIARWTTHPCILYQACATGGAALMCQNQRSWIKSYPYCMFKLPNRHSPVPMSHLDGVLRRHRPKHCGQFAVWVTRWIHIQLLIFLENTPRFPAKRSRGKHWSACFI